MYTNNQNYGYNMNDNKCNCSSNQYMNCGCTQECTTQPINYGYNYDMNNTACRCDAQAQKGIEKMNMELKRLNAANILPQMLLSTMQRAQDDANKLKANTFLPYAPDPDNFYSNFQELRFGVLKSDDYYDRAIEQLIKGYECCKRNLEKNSSCWYTKQHDCEGYLAKVKDIMNQIAPKKSLLLQTLKSTGNLAVEVDKSESVVLSATTAVRLPLEYGLALTNGQMHYLNESYNEKYSAYDCCKKHSSYDSCHHDEPYTGICDCKNAFRASNESILSANDLGTVAANQIALATTAFKGYVDSIEKSQQASSYLYAAMSQSSSLSRDINELWEQAFQEAMNLYNCCSEESPGASCCSTNCSTFLTEATRLKELAKVQRDKSLSAEVNMNKSINDATAIKAEELLKAKEAQVMADQIFAQYSSIASEITTKALPMMDDAYNCCSII